MVTDAVNIKDAFVINIGVEYQVIIRPDFAAREVLLRCTQALQNHFDVRKWNINQPINLASIYTLLDKVKGVQTVQEVKIKNKTNGNYSQYSYDIEGATRNNIVYPSYDPCIFEVKFPDVDIVGRVTTL
jgi:phage-related baseplate assembly protein